MCFSKYALPLLLKKSVKILTKRSESQSSNILSSKLEQRLLIEVPTSWIKLSFKFRVPFMYDKLFPH